MYIYIYIHSLCCIPFQFGFHLSKVLNIQIFDDQSQKIHQSTSFHIIYIDIFMISMDFPWIFHVDVTDFTGFPLTLTSSTCSTYVSRRRRQGSSAVAELAKRAAALLDLPSAKTKIACGGEAWQESGLGHG